MKAKEVLDTYHNFAVIGATTDSTKFGYKIFKRLIDLKYQVFPISPKYSEIRGIKAYSNLINIKEPIDVAVFIVNPTIGKQYVDQCVSLGIKHIWLQPNTYDDELLSYIESFSINYYLACVLVETNAE